jgi:hypothetical protein
MRSGVVVNIIIIVLFFQRWVGGWCFMLFGVVDLIFYVQFEVSSDGSSS